MAGHRGRRGEHWSGAERLPDCEAVHGYVGRICFKTGPPATVGAELEWLVHRPGSPHDPVPLNLLRSVLESAGPPPGGSTITFEPGGQLELSSRPVAGLAACWRNLESDRRYLDEAMALAGLSVLPTAIDPLRRPVRQLYRPRYDTMEAYFDRRGRHGRVMMCSTAAVQVNLDAGADPPDVARRWHLLNALGPVLTSAFANSPVHAGRATGWKSTRQLVWQRLDPARTAALPAGKDPATAWAEYALDAPVMAMRRDGLGWLPDPGLTFRQWITGAARGTPAAGGGPPTEEDLAYHLTTLFPPVRPRGWLEVRYVDAQAPEWWPVPVAVLSALVDDPGAADRALAAAEPVAGEWRLAARAGPEDSRLAQAARECFEAALGALHRRHTDSALTGLVEAYLDAYVLRGRCPADDAGSGRAHPPQVLPPQVPPPQVPPSQTDLQADTGKGTSTTAKESPHDR